MNKITKGMFGFLIVSVVFGAPLALAKGGGGHPTGTPSGFGQGGKKGWKGENTPPGWSHGKKTGWHDAHRPPGLAKKQDGSSPETEGKETEEKKED